METIGHEYEIIQLDAGPNKDKYAVFSREVYSLTYPNGGHVTSYWTNTHHCDEYFDSRDLAIKYINGLETKCMRIF